MIPRRFHSGPLRFSSVEAGTGIPVLMLHGFPDHAFTFRAQIEALAAAGYHAIAPMMRGYEPSSQPADGDYRLQRLAEDVLAFIEQSGQRRVHLVGHDWGAVVSYLVAAMAPERLISLTTLAIPSPGRLGGGLLQYPSQLLKSWYILFFQLPLIPEIVLRSRNAAFLEWLWRRWSPGWMPTTDELSQLKTIFAQPGVAPAALGYYRALRRLRPFREAQTTLAHLRSPIDVPTLAMTGARDGCMDTRLHEAIMHARDYPRGLEVVRMEDAGHFLQQERPDQVNASLLRHFRQAECKASGLD